jgi:hypothetical protein
MAAEPWTFGGSGVPETHARLVPPTSAGRYHPGTTTAVIRRVGYEVLHDVANGLRGCAGGGQWPGGGQGGVCVAPPALPATLEEGPSLAWDTQQDAWRSGSGVVAPDEKEIATCADVARERDVADAAARVQLAVGVSTACGHRPRQEDVTCVVPDLIGSNQSIDESVALPPPSVTYVGVFDGHNGVSAAQFAADNLHQVRVRHAFQRHVLLYHGLTP